MRRLHYIMLLRLYTCILNVPLFSFSHPAFDRVTKQCFRVESASKVASVYFRDLLQVATVEYSLGHLFCTAFVSCRRICSVVTLHSTLLCHKYIWFDLIWLNADSASKMPRKHALLLCRNNAMSIECAYLFSHSASDNVITIILLLTMPESNRPVCGLYAFRAVEKNQIYQIIRVG